MRSVDRWRLCQIVMLSPHGGNENVPRITADDLVLKLDIQIVHLSPSRAAIVLVAKILEAQGVLCRACEADTSNMMALRPDLVAVDRIRLAHSNYMLEASNVVGFTKRSFRNCLEALGMGRSGRHGMLIPAAT